MPPSHDPREKDVNRLVRRHLRSPVAVRLGLRLRRYQVVAALASYDHMIAGRNVVCNLPTGTGKTMVANILSLLLLSERPTMRCLYLAPARTLAQQHRHYSNWLAPKYQTLLLLDEQSSPERLHKLALRSHIVVSTPELCANLIRSHALPSSVVASFCMISIDEFDDHFVFGYSDKGPTARLDAQFSKLHRCLPKDVPVQLVSATDPKALEDAGNTDPVVTSFSRLMDATYDPVTIEVPARLYARHIPTAAVVPVEVRDRNVFFLSWAISVEMARTFDKIMDETGLLVSRDDVLTRLEAILKGNTSFVRLVSGSSARLGHFDMSHFYRLRDLLNHHEHLYEDMFAGLEYEIRKTRIFSLALRRYVRPPLPRLVDNRPANEFHPKLMTKAEALLEILAERQGQPGVLFTRKTRLSEALHRAVSRAGWSAVQVDSRFTDRERDKRLGEFRDRKHDLLIITRRTGRRGLDLPQAEFSVFYSPKARETTTWQELSRIRSSVHRTKTSYFLSYASTADSRRMSSLERAMENSGREYTLLPRRTHGESEEHSGFEDFVEATGNLYEEV